MKVTPIAFDSLGTRSMCTLVETSDVRIIIDPGVSIAPKRYGLEPHPLEKKRMAIHWKEIQQRARSCDVVILTHYHHDHYNPSEGFEIYRNKILLIKNPTSYINKNQARRAKEFLSSIDGLPAEIIHADGKEFSFSGTRIVISRPVFHGTDEKLGFVIEVLIDDGYRFIHTSDVEGPAMDGQADFILSNRPNLVILDGPMTSMLGFKYSKQHLQASKKNMVKLIEECPIETLVVDHHLLRDLRWKQRLAEVIEWGKKRGVRVITAAGYLGKKDDQLEALRKELYKQKSPIEYKREKVTP